MSADLSVIVPARNAEPWIERCLDLILAQTVDRPFEVVVAVGPSDDATDDIVSRRAANDPRLRWVANPTGQTPAALNLAIAHSSGSLLVRVDAQSEIPEDYLQRLVDTAARTGAANVGGRQVPVGTDRWSRAIATAMTSPWGAGPATFRRAGQEGPADTVYLGAFDRAALQQVGGFNEDFLRNQDYELNWRLRSAGYLVWFDPTIAVTYRPRTSLRRLAHQYRDYGCWKRRMLLANPRSLRLRQTAPPLLLLALFGSVTSALWLGWWPLTIPALYVTAVAAAGFAAARQPASPHEPVETQPDTLLRRWPRVAAAIATMHLSWGSGFLFSRGS